MGSLRRLTAIAGSKMRCIGVTVKYHATAIQPDQQARTFAFTSIPFPVAGTGQHHR
jgi:hypothetical protein